jgi:hypothetical protein
VTGEQHIRWEALKIALAACPEPKFAIPMAEKIVSYVMNGSAPEQADKPAATGSAAVA